MVCRWGPDVQQGAMEMTLLLVKLIAAKLKHGPVPVKLLGLLSQVEFDVICRVCVSVSYVERLDI